MRDPSKDCVPIGPTSAAWRCVRHGDDGRAIELGALHYDHAVQGFRIAPTAEEQRAETYPTMREAAAALLAHHLGLWLDIRRRHETELREADALVALLRGLPRQRDRPPSPNAPPELLILRYVEMELGD